MKICVNCSQPIDGDLWYCEFCGWRAAETNGFTLLAPDLLEGFGGYPAGAHGRLAPVESANFWFLNRNALILHFLDRYFPSALRMLEVGCGTGFVLSAISQRHPDMVLWGGDAYPSGLKFAQGRVPSAKLVQLNAGRLPFIDEFDVIGAFDVIEHIHDDRQALLEINKALKPDGGLILTVPQHAWLWSETDQNAGHQRRYCRKLLGSRLRSAGFRILKMTSFISLLLPLMFGIRKMGRLRGKNRSQQSTPGIILSNTVNRLLYGICGIERSIIRTGVSLPIGGSLACVAKKV